MTEMTQEDKRRIMSTQAKAGHDMSSKGFAARAAAAAADRQANEAAGSSGANGEGSRWWPVVQTAVALTAAVGIAAGVAWWSGKKTTSDEVEEDMAE